MEIHITRALLGDYIKEMQVHMRHTGVGRDLDIEKLIPPHMLEWLKLHSPDFSIRMARTRIKWDKDLMWNLFEKKTGRLRQSHKYFSHYDSKEKIISTNLKIWVDITDPKKALMFKLTF